MTVFYNPKQRKPHPWVFIVFVIMPIVITIGVIILGQKRVQKKIAEEIKQKQIDIFDKF